MTDLIEFAQAEPAEAYTASAPYDASAPYEARFPVAYSHGGFAQLRHAIAATDVNPLAPIQVPDECDPALAANYSASPVVFLRS